MTVDIYEPEAELFLGPLDLVGFDPESPFRLEALSTDGGTSWGNAGAIDVEMRSFLQHGSLVVTEGWENRVLTLAVSVTEDPGLAEAMLLSQLHKPNTVTYKPRTSPVRTVFQALTSTLVPVDDDLLENFDAEVIYQIKLTCRPFARGDDLITVEALAAGEGGQITATIEDITTGSTGWTGLAYKTSGGMVLSTDVDVLADGVEIAATLADAEITFFFTKTYPAVDTTELHYLAVEWRYNTTDKNSPTIKLRDPDDPAPVEFSAVASMVSPDDAGFIRSFYDISGLDQFTVFEFSGALGGASPTARMAVGNLALTNYFGTGSPRQQLRRLDLHGTMPTTGSLEIHHPTQGLGETLFYSCRGDSGGYNPACRSYLQPRTDPSVLDPTAVSGYYDPLMNSEPSYFYIPNAALPTGDYTILASMSLEGGTVTLNGSASAWMYDAPIGEPETFADALVVNSTDGQYRLIELGDIHFPVIKASDGSLSRTSVTISVTSSDFDAVFKFDDIFLLNLSTGQFTLLNCGTGEPVAGGPSNRMWIDSPDIGNSGQPEIWRGSAVERSDAVGAWIYAEAVDIHEFDPQYDVTTFLITLGPDTAPAVRFHYYPAFWYRAYPVEP